MTTQNQVSVPAQDEGFHGVGRGSNRIGTFAIVAKGTVSKRVSITTEAPRPGEARLVDGLRQMIISCWRNESGGRTRSLFESTTIRGTERDAKDVRVPQGNLRQGKGDYETSCEILKQVADRFHYRSRPSTEVVFDYFLSGNCMHWKHFCNELTKSEAKFFLDRGKRSPYHSHKFSGAFPARAKFHLHAKGKVVNCCSHFWGGADGPITGHDGTRFRKAETDRPNQANESIPRLRSLREDRPVGVISIPSAHGRRQN
jgi:hypothetical protein